MINKIKTFIKTFTEIRVKIGTTIILLILFSFSSITYAAVVSRISFNKEMKNLERFFNEKDIKNIKEINFIYNKDKRFQEVRKELIADYYEKYNDYYNKGELSEEEYQDFLKLIIDSNIK